MGFDFGQNWEAFSRNALTSWRVEQARQDFLKLFKGIPLYGKTFLDIGFGQGLSLLIAAEMGANAVGCDINPKCLSVLERNREAFFTSLDPNALKILIGSILSEDLLESLRNWSPKGNGTYDIVHSWGVLHHTGDMRRAIRNAASLVSAGGTLVLALYNRHWTSKMWLWVKRLYCFSSAPIRRLLVLAFIPPIYLAKALTTGKNPNIMERGMDFHYDIVDWIGGYPYEYATVDEIETLLGYLGFERKKRIRARVPTGCNEFVFRKTGQG